jgi:hypothetical protein
MHATEVEQCIANELAGPVIHELPAALGKYKVSTEGHQLCMFRCGFRLRLALPTCVDSLVLEEKKDVLV